jgi:hypothetical protein
MFRSVAVILCLCAAAQVAAAQASGSRILSGLFGDFSGLGVAHIRTRESLPDVLTARVQVGSFDTFRSFLAYSPALKDTVGFIAYEAHSAAAVSHEAGRECVESV